MEEKKKITPELAAGFRDYLPENMIPRQEMLDIIRNVFERFGFVPLGTPALEIESILTGGDPNFRMNIFKTNVQKDFDKLCLRFDLTVPLARVIAQYQNELKLPLKRYQVGPVWRAEKPQAGRYREFFQFDADTVGSASMMADAEIIAIMYSAMTALGVENFRIRVNDRKILNGLSQYAGYPAEKNVDVLRVIDKLDKQGWDAVKIELMGTEIAEGDERGGPGLSSEQAESIKKFLDLRGATQDEVLSNVSELMKDSSMAQEGINELSEVLKNVRALGVPDGAWMIDLSVARGLGYYTGPVFETTLLDLPEFGSVFSGGRYDDLVSRFGNVSIPATGASIGVDRLFAALEKLGRLKTQKSIAKVMVLNFDTKAESYVQEIASLLRNAGIPTQVYFGNESKLRDQLGFASTSEIPMVIIAGGNEMEKNVALMKDMKSGKQETIDKSEIPAKVKSVLKTSS